MNVSKSPLPRLRRPELIAALLLVPLGCSLFDFSSPVLKHESAPIDPSAGAAGRAPDEEIRTCAAGSNECGEGRTCFRASALAGQDFCADACDPADATDAEHRCVDSGALLQICHPNGQGPAADCPTGLNCYRTSLSENRGLCIMMPVCESDADCPSLDHELCASSLVETYAGASLLQLNHLNCMHPNCVSLKSQCPTSEGCLGTQYSTDIADICTPKCDKDGDCPPNFSCARATSGPGSVNLCLPGVPGFRCSRQNCVAGSCQDTGAGFSVCTIACADDSDCLLLDTPTDSFACVTGGEGRHCVTPRPFNGANCNVDEDCIAERSEKCFNLDVLGESTHGECRVQCNGDGTCDPQGGLPHTCLWNGAGGCFPGRLGLPCKKDSECFSGQCQTVPADSELGLSETTICTLPCGKAGETEAEADAECDSPSSINRGGFCSSGHCRMRQPAGASCVRNDQCASSRCDVQHRKCVDRLDPPIGH
ncbi:MAG TPA: hypothetical protein VHB79_37590 [Polyangiaceae bacterium]|nr:hypothetical protein [Polyangiaceae bacterium]